MDWQSGDNLGRMCETETEMLWWERTRRKKESKQTRETTKRKEVVTSGSSCLRGETPQRNAEEENHRLVALSEDVLQLLNLRIQEAGEICQSSIYK